jgi:hypothetical protein
MAPKAQNAVKKAVKAKKAAPAKVVEKVDGAMTDADRQGVVYIGQ